MSSLRTMFIGICLAVFFCLTNGLAIRAADCNERVTPTLPLTGDATELPSANLTALSYIAIGRGVQNYTCTGAGSNSTAVGAIATLFDATELAYYDEDALHAIPPVVVYRPVPSASLHAAGSTLPVLGHHYFNAAGVPTFDLSTKSKIFYGAKTGDIKAPATADKGPAGTGAVDWLQLSAKAGYTSVGETMVYRLVTAGGVAPACTAAGLMTVEYAAEYWFFN